MVDKPTAHMSRRFWERFQFAAEILLMVGWVVVKFDILAPCKMA